MICKWKLTHLTKIKPVYKKALLMSSIDKSFCDKPKPFFHVKETEKIKTSVDNMQKVIGSKSKEEEDENIPLLLKGYSMKLASLDEIDDIKHNVEVEGVEYKYGIPVKNENFRLNSAIVENENSSEYFTPMESIMDQFGLDKDSAYEALVLKYDEYYNFEVDMYGDRQDAGLVTPEVFKEGLPIPIKFLKDEKEMNLVREFYRYNVELPGNVLDVHPLKFVPNLTPVEEFRHTPVTPISEKTIKEHQKKIAEKKRSEEYFEVDKKKLRFYFLSLIFAFIIYKVFIYASTRGEKREYEVQKLRHRRFRYRDDERDFI